MSKNTVSQYSPFYEEIAQITPTSATYELTTIKQLAPFTRHKLTLMEQSSTWRSQMALIGNQLTAKQVDRIILVHGTFVGQDPWDMSPILQQFFRRTDRTVESFRSAFKQHNDRIVQDSGNFTDEYTALLDASFNHQIDVEKFCWSSGNNHIARLRGAFELIKRLALTNVDQKKHTLLLGHSHAGQLFALITQLIHLVDRRRIFWKILKLDRNQEVFFNLVCDRLAHTPLDFVTLGMPIRYHWLLYAPHRALHFINHRGGKPYGQSRKGILTTTWGDYIQQLGIEGSDTISTNMRDYQFNKQLNQYLGFGFDLNYWRQLLRKQVRVGPVGHTILADYGDRGGGLNCFATMFGHGAYTRYENMLYHFHEVNSRMYNNSI